jgi:effector-binding domain-containing protein
MDILYRIKHIWSRRVKKVVSSKKGQMFSEPKIEQRSEQPYFGIRTQVPMKEMKKAIPKCLEEVFAWLGMQGIAPAGAPFIRYHVINMADKMDIEIGVPVANILPETGLQNDPPMNIKAGTLPAGQYAALIYTGVKNGIKANAALLEWGAKQGLMWDRWDVENGDAFRSRYETFITDPKDEPDSAKWKTEVAIRLAEHPTR